MASVVYNRLKVFSRASEMVFLWRFFTPYNQPCRFAKGKKFKFILSGLQQFSGSLQVFLSCTGKWCLKGQANQRCHLDGDEMPQIMLLFLSMCNYSICAVSKGLFPLSVPHLFTWGAKTFNTQITFCCPSLSLLTEGCPGLCNSNGRCTLDQNGWHCVCQPGWRGAGCDVAMETLCTDSKDNEGGKRRWAGKRACAGTQVYEFSRVPGYLLPKKKNPIPID